MIKFTVEKYHCANYNIGNSKNKYWVHFGILQGPANLLLAGHGNGMIVVWEVCKSLGQPHPNNMSTLKAIIEMYYVNHNDVQL